MSRKPRIAVTDAVEFACPFCGGKGVARVQQRSVMHTAPFCDKFQEMDVEDFIHAVNAKLRPSTQN